jgi:hypothetical protein
VSKKKFSSGLDSLFDVPEDIQDTMAAEAAPSVFEEQNGNTRIGSVSTMTRKASSKNFTSDLDSLFSDAFTDAVEEKVEKLRRASGIEDPFEDNRRAYKQPLSGLDALIRSTIDTSLAGFDHAAVKRLTIFFENYKVDKLKSIAKSERSFVKDLVNGVLTEYINNYEKRMGEGAK